MEAPREPHLLNHHFYTLYTAPSISLCRKANIISLFDENSEIVTTEKSCSIIFCSRIELLFTNICILPRDVPHPRMQVWITNERPVWLSSKNHEEDPVATLEIPLLQPRERFERKFGSWVHGNYVGLRLYIPDSAVRLDDPIAASIMKDLKEDAEKFKAQPTMEPWKALTQEQNIDIGAPPSPVAGDKPTRRGVRKNTNSSPTSPTVPPPPPASRGALGTRRTLEMRIRPRPDNADSEKKGSATLYEVRVGPLLAIGFEATSIPQDTPMYECHNWNDTRHETLQKRMLLLTMASGTYATAHVIAPEDWTKAVMSNSVETVRKHLEKNPRTPIDSQWLIGINTNVVFGACTGSALHYAAVVAANPVAMIHELLAHKADINCKALNTGETPLHWACRHGRAEAATALLDRGADINALATGSITPIILAASRNNVEIVEFLLQRKANLRVVSIIGSVLPVALGGGNMILCRRLMAAGAPLDGDSPVAEPLLKDYSFIKMLLSNQKLLHPSLTGTIARVSGLVGLAKQQSSYFSYLSPDLLEHMLTYVLHAAIPTPTGPVNAPYSAHPYNSSGHPASPTAAPVVSAIASPLQPSSPALVVDYPAPVSPASSTATVSSRSPFQFAPPSPLSYSGLASDNTFTFGAGLASSAPAGSSPVKSNQFLAPSSAVFSMGSTSSSPKKSPTKPKGRRDKETEKDHDAQE